MKHVYLLKILLFVCFVTMVDSYGCYGCGGGGYIKSWSVSSSGEKIKVKNFGEFLFYMMILMLHLGGGSYELRRPYWWGKK
jgi:hypothetical protein